MKKILIALAALMAVLVIVYFAMPAKQTETVVESTPEVNDFPNMPLALPDGTSLNAKSLEGKSILILYFTGCDHCQREAMEISNKLKSFEGYNLWFLTTDSFPSMDQFATDYKLKGNPNVHFAQITFPDVATHFGAIPTPSVYLYSQSKKLVKAFNGETPVDQIVPYL